MNLHQPEFGPPPCQCCSVVGVFEVGGPDHGGGPLLSLQHSRLPNDFNPVNHPFRLSEMTENGLGVNPSRGAVRPGSNRGGWRSPPNSLFRGYQASSSALLCSIRQFLRWSPVADLH